MIAARLAGVGASYGAVIRSPRYFPLWLGQLVSNFGDTLHYIALVGELGDDRAHPIRISTRARIELQDDRPALMPERQQVMSVREAPRSPDERAALCDEVLEIKLDGLAVEEDQRMHEQVVMDALS